MGQKRILSFYTASSPKNKHCLANCHPREKLFIYSQEDGIILRNRNKKEGLYDKSVAELQLSAKISAGCIPNLHLVGRKVHAAIAGPPMSFAGYYCNNNGLCIISEPLL